jgi:hypothetical protein
MMRMMREGMSRGTTMSIDEDGREEGKSGIVWIGSCHRQHACMKA